MQDKNGNEHISETMICDCPKCGRGILVALIDLIYDIYVKTVVCSVCDRESGEKE